MARQVVDEPAVAVLENRQSVGPGAGHDNDAALVRHPMRHRAVGQPDGEARSAKIRVFAGHRQLAPCHAFPALVRRRAIHEQLGRVIGEVPTRGRHAGDGQRWPTWTDSPRPTQVSRATTRASAIANRLRQIRDRTHPATRARSAGRVARRIYALATVL